MVHCIFKAICETCKKTSDFPGPSAARCLAEAKSAGWIVKPAGKYKMQSYCETCKGEKKNANTR